MWICELITPSSAANQMQYRAGLRLVFVLWACLAQSAIAQCRVISERQADPAGDVARHPDFGSSLRQSDDRAVLLDLELTKTGAVRSVRVLSGSPEFRRLAIKAAARRKYHPPPGFNPYATSVNVRFPLGPNKPPYVREMMVGGVPGCVYALTIIRITMPELSMDPPWLMQLLSLPVVPATAFRRP